MLDENFIRLINRDNKKIIISGHSFGGSLAQLHTIRYITSKDYNPKKDEIYCITFGHIFSMKEELTKYINDNGLSKFFINILNDKDPIPILFDIYFKCINIILREKICIKYIFYI